MIISKYRYIDPNELDDLDTRIYTKFGDNLRMKTLEMVYQMEFIKMLDNGSIYEFFKNPKYIDKHNILYTTYKKLLNEDI